MPQSAYQRAKDISLQLDDQPRRAAVLVGLATVFEARGDYLKSQLLIEEYLGEVADKGSGLLLVESPQPPGLFAVPSGRLRSIRGSGGACRLAL